MMCITGFYCIVFRLDTPYVWHFERFSRGFLLAWLSKRFSQVTKAMLWFGSMASFPVQVETKVYCVMIRHLLQKKDIILGTAWCSDEQSSSERAEVILLFSALRRDI